MYGFREFCDAGGLLCYGTNLSSLFSRYGYFIDKILKGTKPGDIPIEEPTTIELIVNARVAKSLGLTLPTSILISADELIEYAARAKYARFHAQREAGISARRPSGRSSKWERSRLIPAIAS